MLMFIYTVTIYWYIYISTMSMCVGAIHDATIFLQVKISGGTDEVHVN